jgi:allantoin racemase
MALEMGGMMAGIIMAGRTGAAFAAQLGTMTVNEEIDALATLGIPPIEFLVLPRVLAREIAHGPVLGIAEAAMHAASLIATGFSVVTTLARTRIIAEHLVEVYGMRRLCRRVRASDLAVLDLEVEGSEARRIVTEECRRALYEDGAGAIVLGCAGMADLAAEISEEIGAPVIDGVACAVKFAEALVALGLRTSKHGDLAYPLAKPYRGVLAHLAPGQTTRGRG